MAACEAYSPPKVDRLWLWAYYNKILIYPIFYLLKGDYESACVTWIIQRWTILATALLYKRHDCVAGINERFLTRKMRISLFIGCGGAHFPEDARYAPIQLIDTC